MQCGCCWDAVVVCDSVTCEPHISRRFGAQMMSARTMQQLHTVALAERQECKAASCSLPQRQLGPGRNAAGVSKRGCAAFWIIPLLLCEAELRNQPQSSGISSVGSRSAAHVFAARAISRVEAAAELQRDHAQISW